MVDMRILSDPYEEECFLILKSNLPKMKDEDALELYIKLKKSFAKFMKNVATRSLNFA